MKRTAVILTLIAGLSASPVGSEGAVTENPVPVPATSETTPGEHTGDSMDDPAIWVNPNSPADSLIIGNDKQGALEVYGLDGARRQHITSAAKFWGNVDVRQNVTVNGRTTDVIAAVNGGALRLYTVDPVTLNLTSIADNGGALSVGGGEGLCLYDSSVTGQLSAVVITRAGRVRQFRVTDSDNDGLLQVLKVREFLVGSEAEGCVADDETGDLFISQEDVALWRYGAEPETGSDRTLVDSLSPDGHLVADIEGVTLVERGGTKYLIASAQNVAQPWASYFTVYDAATSGFVQSFQITSGPAADKCQRTDGITAYSGDLGPAFPEGIFICQDNFNSAPGFVGNQSFKLTRLETVLG